MSTDMAISLSKKFIRQISQPFDHTQTGISLWTLEDIEDKQKKDEEERERAAREYGDAFGTIRTPAVGMGEGGFAVDAMGMDVDGTYGGNGLTNHRGAGQDEDGMPDEDELRRMEQYEKEMEEAAGMQVDEDMDMGLTDEALAGVDMP
jgi:hypothetical protein